MAEVGMAMPSKSVKQFWSESWGIVFHVLQFLTAVRLIFSQSS